MKKVLIFGSNGFVGPYLVKEFLNNGYEVFASDIQDASISQNVTYFKGNVLDKEGIAEIIKSAKPDYVINLAAISSVGLSWKNPELTHDINVNGTVNILDAIKDFAPNAKLMVVGSSEEYVSKDTPLCVGDELNANNPYGKSKCEQEEKANEYQEKYGLRIIKVRSFNHTGIGQKDTFVIPSFCKQVAEIQKSGKDGTIYVGNLSAIRDFSSVEDIVKTYRLLLETKDSGTFNVGSGKAYQIKEILEMIISFATVKIDVQIDPDKFRNVDTPFICCGDKQLFKFKDIRLVLKELYEYYLK